MPPAGQRESAGPGGSAGDGVAASYGYGDGGAAVVHDRAPSQSPSMLDARTNHALPQQMYDALLAARSPTKQSTASRPRGHRKRHAAAAEVTVFRQQPAVGGPYRLESDALDVRTDGNDVNDWNSVDIVPLDVERRIRVNLTIAADGGPAGGDAAVYAVSLSLPRAGLPDDPQARAVVPGRHPLPPAAVPPAGGTECECYCPCLEQDDEDVGAAENSTANAVWTTTTTVAVSEDAFDSSTFRTTPNDEYDGGTSWPSSIPPAGLTDEFSPATCPPPVMMFCSEPGK